MTSSSAKTVSFFGATGGCAASCLVRTLQAGHQAIALARTPSKLTDLLKSKGVSEKLIASNLRIVHGDITDPAAVRSTLTTDDQVSDIIINSIGGEPILRFSLFEPIDLPQRDICEVSIKHILASLNDLRPAHTPVLAMVSTAGTATTYRDWPLPMFIFYRWMLNAPIRDKRAAHARLTAHAADESNASCVFVSVRASHLTDGEALGMQKIREGWEEAPAVGYSISREDVGLWMYERVVAPAGEMERKEGGVVNITY